GEAGRRLDRGDALRSDSSRPLPAGPAGEAGRWAQGGKRSGVFSPSSGPNSFTGRTSRQGSRLGAPLGRAIGTGSPAGPAGRGQVGLVLELGLPPEIITSC